MKTVEDVPYLVHVFRFFYLIYIIYDDLSMQNWNTLLCFTEDVNL